MKAIVFDCDGTLVDSEYISTEVLVDSVATHGLELSIGEASRLFRGRKMADSVTELEARLGRSLPADFVPKLRARIAEQFRTELRPIPGALELVAALKQTICVASNAPRDKIELTLSLTRLLPYFEGRIFSSYEVGTWKPDPGLFLHAARMLGVAPEDCAVVEDSMYGIRAGLAAGMSVFAYVPNGIEMELPAGVSVVSDLLELRSIFAEN